ncbi:uncharacterized protein LOC128233460 [Mya arenaria]|uniref:uncharacterized protein LOC128233460 n=1 Tax=Mya arenaria TaxID=6604 RepID=UPI0022E81D17|nr:uncharacterized protein LOC128233460 [Mya arenaria]
MSVEDLKRYNSLIRSTSCSNVTCDMSQEQSFTFGLNFSETSVSLLFVEAKIVHPMFTYKLLVWRSSKQYPVGLAQSAARSFAGWKIGVIAVLICLGIGGIVGIICCIYKYKKNKEQEEEEEEKKIEEEKKKEEPEKKEKEEEEENKKRMTREEEKKREEKKKEEEQNRVSSISFHSDLRDNTLYHRLRRLCTHGCETVAPALLGAVYKKEPMTLPS